VEADLVDDPLRHGGLAGLAADLRSGRRTAAGVVEDYLRRIAVLDPVLCAFEHVGPEGARRSARAVDAMLAAGMDLGPLMGVPVAVKDVIAVQGMPTHAGSNVDVADLVGQEGTFIRRLRRAGCVLVGKTHTVEFAFGSTGTNYRRGTPRNPWDAQTFRLTSGSSSGSAVAVAAGMCAFSIGTDTGGSVRGPAAFCGTFGFKGSAGLWPMDGIFPMSRTLDSLGFLTASAADACFVWEALTEEHGNTDIDARGLRFGLPRRFALQDVDADVGKCMEAALSALSRAGAEIIDVDLPDIDESNRLFQMISRSEIVATFGKSRVESMLEDLNPDVADRIVEGLGISCDEYIRAMWRRTRLASSIHDVFNELDALITPTKQRVAPPYPGEFVSVALDRELARQCAGATRPANAFDLCASSQPMQVLGSDLPVGFQLMGPRLTESRLLAMARACERVFGLPGKPDVNRFLTSPAR